MTGGDRMVARYMRAEFFEFEPAFKVWVATNHRPEIRGTDEGIWRRIRLIPFTPVETTLAERTTTLVETTPAETTTPAEMTPASEQ